MGPCGHRAAQKHDELAPSHLPPLKLRRSHRTELHQRERIKLALSAAISHVRFTLRKRRFSSAVKMSTKGGYKAVSFWHLKPNFWPLPTGRRQQSPVHRPLHTPPAGSRGDRWPKAK